MTKAISQLSRKEDTQVSRKTFIIDTNVLVHDPSAIKKFKENDVVITVAVLEELDGLKRHTDEVGKNAREVIRYIDSLKAEKGDLHLGVEIPEGPKVRVHLEAKYGKDFHFPLNLDRPANRLLMNAYLLKEKGEMVVIVTKDFITRVKADALELESEDYESLKTSYEELYRGIRRMQVAKKDVDQFLKDGTIQMAGEGFRPNEYVYLSSPENSTALCKYNEKSKKLESLLSVSAKEIWGIQPLNVEQRCAIDLLLRDDIQLITLIGQAGTGKTLLALACGIFKVFEEEVYSRILISRPIVPLGKDIGYLPGTKEEKLYHWMQPIYDNLEFLCTSKKGEKFSADNLEYIMETKKIEMEAVTYIRGRSLPKMYIIIDEAQNLTPHEVKTIISRAGKGTKVILTGDPTQIDNPYLDKDSNGLTYCVNRFKNHRIYGHMFLERTERSELASIAAELL
jgi:PhoH-like ATPase